MLRRGMFMPGNSPNCSMQIWCARAGNAPDSYVFLNRRPAASAHRHLRIAALEMTWYMRHQSCATPTGPAWTIRSKSAASGRLRIAAQNSPSALRTDRQTSHGLHARAATPHEVLTEPKPDSACPSRWLLEEDADFRAERGLRGWTRLCIPLAWRTARFPAPDARRDGTRTSSPVHSSRPARRVLVFRIGQLGDTIAALPALWVVRNHFRDAESRCSASAPWQTARLRPRPPQGQRLVQKLRILPRPRRHDWPRQASARHVQTSGPPEKERFDTLVYLSPSARSAAKLRAMSVSSVSPASKLSSAPTGLPPLLPGFLAGLSTKSTRSRIAPRPHGRVPHPGASLWPRVHGPALGRRRKPNRDWLRGAETRTHHGAPSLMQTLDWIWTRLENAANAGHSIVSWSWQKPNERFDIWPFVLAASKTPKTPTNCS